MSTLAKCLQWVKGILGIKILQMKNNVLSPKVAHNLLGEADKLNRRL
jgi:hypothetical protein